MRPTDLPQAAGAVLAVVIFATGASATGDRAYQGDAARAESDIRIVDEFLKRVEAYADSHRKLEGTLPQAPSKPTPEHVDAHQRALSRLIVQSRGRASQGEIFNSECRAYLRRQIARALAGPDSALLRASIMDENPGRIRVQVNGRYPDEVPLSTMPPQVLAALPKLPDELEYRFIAERLILLDVHAHLVVDYIDNALPR